MEQHKKISSWSGLRKWTSVKQSYKKYIVIPARIKHYSCVTQTTEKSSSIAFCREIAESAKHTTIICFRKLTREVNTWLRNV
jgi:hypothetical protein